MKRLCASLLFLGLVAVGCHDPSQPTADVGPAVVPAKPSTVALPPAAVQAGTGHPAFTIAYQPPAHKFGYISVVVAQKTKDEDVARLLWYFRSMIAAHRLQNLGIHPQAQLPSGEETGMIFVFKGKKCATEVDEEIPASDEPCGFGEHDSGYYLWGIPRHPPFSDEGAVIATGGGTNPDREKQRVFASEDDNWKVSDEVKTLLK